MSKDWANPPGVDLLLELPGGQRRAGLEDALREAVRGGLQHGKRSHVGAITRNQTNP
jgi:hypothetical protein